MAPRKWPQPPFTETARLFSEVWSRLVGDTRALQGVLESCTLVSPGMALFPMPGIYDTCIHT